MTSQNKAPNIPNPLGQFSPSVSAQMDTGVTPLFDMTSLEQRISALEQKRTNLNTDVFGLFETVSAAPTGTPKDVYDQIKIYRSGTTYRLYWYDTSSQNWHYATGT